MSEWLVRLCDGREVVVPAAVARALGEPDPTTVEGVAPTRAAVTRWLERQARAWAQLERLLDGEAREHAADRAREARMLLVLRRLGRAPWGATAGGGTRRAGRGKGRRARAGGGSRDRAVVVGSREHVLLLDWAAGEVDMDAPPVGADPDTAVEFFDELADRWSEWAGTFADRDAARGARRLAEQAARVAGRVWNGAPW